MFLVLLLVEPDSRSDVQALHLKTAKQLSSVCERFGRGCRFAKTSTKQRSVLCNNTALAEILYKVINLRNGFDRFVRHQTQDACPTNKEPT